MPAVDDALQFLVDYLRRPRSPSGGASYGYEVYIPNVCSAFVTNVERVVPTSPFEIERRIKELSPPFYEAAWELCRRGILRPGVRAHGEQGTSDGSGGNGYCITSRGREWLADAEHMLVVPVEPTRVGHILVGFRRAFGEGFFQRAQEAVKCYSAPAHLACCAMCGAAAESILLHLAIQKNSKEDEVLKLYRTSGGRKRIEDSLLGGVPESMARTFRNMTDLLKYWRDDASHGAASEISEFEAYEALARLLRFAHFASDHISELTRRNLRSGSP